MMTPYRVAVLAAFLPLQLTAYALIVTGFALIGVAERGQAALLEDRR